MKRIKGNKIRFLMEFASLKWAVYWVIGDVKWEVYIMKMFVRCWNCGANINYEINDISSNEYYTQAKARHEGHLIVFPTSLFDIVKVYSIICPQCNKNVDCGKEVLEEDVSIDRIEEKINVIDRQ